MTNAMHKRDVGVTKEDYIILLSTCSSDSTNGRDILFGRITEELYEDQFSNMETNDGKNGANNRSGFVKEIYLPDFIIAVLLIALISVIHYRQKNTRKGRKI